MDKSRTIESKDELVRHIEVGSKPKDAWRIGTEHEKFAFCVDTFQRPGYEGERSIRAILEGFEKLGWKPKQEAGKTIMLVCEQGASITLEPGGQFELSGAPLENIHETCSEVHRHLRDAKRIGEEVGIGFLGLGFDPVHTREQIPVMPKARYEIMRNYMPKVGSLGLDMMFRSCTVQVNLDYASEADMVKKFRTSLALQPAATALFANSPFTEGKPNGFQSFRSHIWTDTDADRCGILPFVFEDGMGFERYADHVLDVPMYFIIRDGQYINTAGQSFRDFMKGELPALPGELPTLSDWEDHLSTLFPEVRMKQFLEMRGADGGPWSRLCALPALWVGLLYEQSSLDAAWDLVKDWSIEDHERVRADTPRDGLATNIPGGKTMREFAGQVLDIARAGLQARARLDTGGDNEVGFLAPLQTAIEMNKTPADILLDHYHGEWSGDVTRIYKECAY